MERNPDYFKPVLPYLDMLLTFRDRYQFTPYTEAARPCVRPQTMPVLAFSVETI